MVALPSQTSSGLLWTTLKILPISALHRSRDDVANCLVPRRLPANFQYRRELDHVDQSTESQIKLGKDLTLVTSLAKYALYRWSRAASCLIRVHIRCRIMNSKKKKENACWTQKRVSQNEFLLYIFGLIHTLRLLDCLHFQCQCQWGTQVGGTCIGSVIAGSYRTRLQSERKWPVNRQITTWWLQ